MTEDTQTLNIRIGNVSLSLGLRVVDGRIVVPDRGGIPFEAWMDGDELPPIDYRFFPVEDIAKPLSRKKPIKKGPSPPHGSDRQES